MKIWETIQFIGPSNPDITTVPEQVTEAVRVSDITENDKFDLDKFIDNLDATTSNQQNIYNIGMHEKLKSLLQKDRISSSANVLHYWNVEKYTDSDMFKLCNVVLGAPSTQVSVERSFSALPVILAKKRFRLTPENLQNVLLIRLNQDLLKNIDFDDVKF